MIRYLSSIIIRKLSFGQNFGKGKIVSEFAQEYDILRTSGYSESPCIHACTLTNRIELGHDFEWNDVKILDKEPVYNKRLISEMLHIRSQTSSLNKQEDTEQLPNSYLPIVNLFPTLEPYDV